MRVSKVASRVYPTCAFKMPISGKPEMGRAAPSFEMTASRSPQDEGGERLRPLQLITCLVTKRELRLRCKAWVPASAGTSGV